MLRKFEKYNTKLNDFDYLKKIIEEQAIIRKKLLKLAIHKLPLVYADTLFDNKKLTVIDLVCYENDKDVTIWVCDDGDVYYTFPIFKDEYEEYIDDPELYFDKERFGL